MGATHHPVAGERAGQPQVGPKDTDVLVALYFIGFVAGLVAGISPCILPVLPVVLVAGTTGTSDAALAEAGANVGRRRSYRAYAVIAGLVLSFSTFTLAGSSLLSALGLPQDFLRDAGLVSLVLSRRD
jgi:cytochrome c biogenesis protein CcdA